MSTTAWRQVPSPTIGNGVKERSQRRVSEPVVKKSPPTARAVRMR